ncbi:hypothetical protein [Terriglobus albidus]|uniref:hypothetical protein n=1 Tax=Terriglobus albidus TaxID=1592106 RepID=UPI00164E091C|nr:hypothetical protein [Terriglobus albidus]
MPVYSFQLTSYGMGAPCILNTPAQATHRCIASPNWQLATGNWQLATGNWQLATGNWQLATGNWQLATGNWQLATGNWQLATGNWQLATGNWQLATGNWLSGKLVFSGRISRNDRALYPPGDGQDLV